MTKLYLDLEETVINNWNDFMLKKPGRIKAFMDANDDIDRDDVRIFSFAIYNDADKATMEWNKPMLERALNCKITSWPSIMEMARASQELTGNRWLDTDSMGGMAIHDYISIVGKPRAFEDWVFFHHGDGERCLLIDDIVPNRTILDHNRGMQIDFINVDALT